MCRIGDENEREGEGEGEREKEREQREKNGRETVGLSRRKAESGNEINLNYTD